MFSFLGKLILWVAILALSIHTGPCSAKLLPSLGHELQLAQRGGEYVYPPPFELYQAEKLFRAMFRGQFGLDIKKKWSDLGFDLLKVSGKSKQYYVLREKPEQKSGRGFYAFSLAPNGVVLEVPHSFDDEYTGKIGVEMFIEHNFSAGAWNTVTRVSADMAHLKPTYFMAFSKAFAKEITDGYLIQIHGYAKAHRTSYMGHQADVVLSTGSRLDTKEIEKIGVCFKKNVSANTKVYPKEVKELGATTNVIGRMLRKTSSNEFIHVEMSLGLRKELLKDAQLRKRLLGCLPG